VKRIVVLGSTGSIGRNVLDVVERHRDEFELVGLAAGCNDELLASQSVRHEAAMLTLSDPSAAARLRKSGLGARVVGTGDGALVDLIEHTAPDLVVNAVVGFVGLRPTMSALSAGISVAIANKETIVTGGEILLTTARESDATLTPIDSEHVAIAQCLRGERLEDVDSIILTASGGALRDRAPETLDAVTVAEVLAHPTWEMGQKITVDSATLVNKGLEVIEAHWLFGVPYDNIEVVIHPQSIVHSMVRFVDGSIMAQMGEPDMRMPILYALSYPRRVPSDLRNDVRRFPDMTFTAVDAERYPCFELVIAAARRGGNAPTIVNAANEVAVGAFLSGEIAFRAIRDMIAAASDEVPWSSIQSMDDIQQTDQETRRWIGKKFGVATG